MKTKGMFRRNLWVIVSLGIGLGFHLKAAAAPVSVTLLHTNDLHSHFRPEKGPLGRGGIARLKTAVDRVRATTPHTLLVDGGDWSEGTIYYTEGTGTEAVSFLDDIGYDAAVVGNHDWLNGPDNLLNAIERSAPKTTFISANLSPDHFERNEEFKKWIPAYFIREIGGVKFAFIGLSTFELIYDSKVLPVTVQEPFAVARALSDELKEKADVVVAISHNSTLVNEGLLKFAPSIDFIVGGHDHKQLNQPIMVSRWGGDPGWIVETGRWGNYLGQMDLTIEDKKVQLVNYKLIQLDSSIPEDPAIAKKVDEIEGRIESKFGNVFHDQVGESEFSLTLNNTESTMGNLVTDAYVAATGADLALDSKGFIYSSLEQGSITTADVFNTIDAVFSPITKKTWTLKILPFSGKHLKWLVNILYSVKKFSAYGPLSVSGMHFSYDPLFMETQTQTQFELSAFQHQGSDTLQQIQSFPVAHDITVNGNPLDTSKMYTVAFGPGMVEAIEFVNSYFPNVISTVGMVDTGKEPWRLVLDSVRNKRISKNMTSYGDRIQTLQTDLGVLDFDLATEQLEKTASAVKTKISVRVKNYGLTASEEGNSEIHLKWNQNGKNYAIDPDYLELGEAQKIPSLAPGESAEFSWVVNYPMSVIRDGDYSVTAKIESESEEVNQTNDEITHWFKVKR